MKDGLKITVGCLGVLLAMVSTPMWCVLLYAILDTINAKPWVWTLYWAYVPVTILCVIIGKLFEYMAKESE